MPHGTKPAPTLFTIGFAATTAEAFFTSLREAGVRRIIDVRLSNTSQLAGFSKKDDLKFFLRHIADIEYLHIPELAPTPELFEAFKKRKGSWPVFEEKFNDLLARRRVETLLSPESTHASCFLCSEKKPHHCHRRLVVEYLEKAWGQARIHHLGQDSIRS